MRIAVHDYAGHPFQFDLSRELARRGHEVGHFYFAGDNGPKGATTLPDDPAGLSVTPIEVAGQYDKANLLLRRRMDQQYGKAAAERIRAFRPDVVISGNTPLDSQGGLLAAAHASGAAFVFWMQDFLSLGMQRLLQKRMGLIGKLIADDYYRRESAMLRKSDGVVVISSDFERRVAELGVPAARIMTIPNWGAIDSLPLRPKANAWSKAHGLEKKFTFLYSGTLAWKHNPDLLWRLAQDFSADGDAGLTLTSAGVCVDQLKARQAEEGQNLINFLPLQPMEVFPDLLGAADVLIALLEPDAGEFSVPSKILSYLCAGRPILLAAPASNLATQIVLEAGAGLCVDPADAEAFCAAARRLHGDPALRTAFGKAGRDYAERTFSISAVTDRFEGAFEAALAQANASKRGPHEAK
ncbi:MAG: glycosyltransferase family 4 protein [Caulobacteraceae bacterium]